MEDHMNLISLSLAQFSLCIAFFLLSMWLSWLYFFPSYRLHCLLSSVLLLLTRLSLCLTAVALLWEVIRKNSTETHTPAAENRAFNTFFSPSLHYNSKRLGVRGRWGKGGKQGTTRTASGNNVGRKMPLWYSLTFMYSGTRCKFNMSYTCLWHFKAKGLVWQICIRAKVELT